MSRSNRASMRPTTTAIQAPMSTRRIFGYGTSATSSVDRFTFTGGVQWNNGAGTLKWTDAANWNPSSAPREHRCFLYKRGAFQRKYSQSERQPDHAFAGDPRHSQLHARRQRQPRARLGLSHTLARHVGHADDRPTGHPRREWHVVHRGRWAVGRFRWRERAVFAHKAKLWHAHAFRHEYRYSQGTIVAAGTLIIANPNAILSGSGLTLGGNAVSMFASPVPMMTQPIGNPKRKRGRQAAVPAFSTAECGQIFPRPPHRQCLV